MPAGASRADSHVPPEVPVSRSVPLAGLVLAAAIAFAACGSSAPTASTVPSPTAPAATTAPAASPTAAATIDAGPVMTLGQARTISADRPLRIRASVVVDTSMVPELVRLCDAMTKSLPPQCAGETVRVEGVTFDRLSQVVQFQQRGHIAWAGSVEFVGKLFGEVFTVIE